MSSAVGSTSAALGRPFVFEDEADPEVGLLTSTSRAALDRTAPSTSLRAGPSTLLRAGLDGCPHTNLQETLIAHVGQSSIKNQPSKIPPASVTRASQLEIRPAPEMVSSGVPAIDALTGGLPRGCLTEIYGPVSSGRTTLLLATLAAATRRGEFCAVIDASDALDPYSAAAAGVDLGHLLWVRCGESSPHKERSPRRRGDTETNSLKDQIQFRSENQSENRLEQVLRATDLLLESGGFGLIVLDLADLSTQSARRIPLTTWFRFRRAVEHKPTILLAIEQHPIAGSCSSLLLKLGVENFNRPYVKTSIAHPPHAQLLTGLDITAELIHSRLDRKPTRSVAFATKTAWAG